MHLGYGDQVDLFCLMSLHITHRQTHHITTRHKQASHARRPSAFAGTLEIEAHDPASPPPAPFLIIIIALNH